MPKMPKAAVFYTHEGSFCLAFLIFLITCGFSYAKTITISKESMKQCFEQYGNGDDFRDCCMLSGKEKQVDTPKKKLTFEEQKELLKNNKKESKIQCDPGKYLPKNAKRCEVCKSGRYYVCVGGSFNHSTTKDQGIISCGSGKIANEFQTQCVESECEPGKYRLGPVCFSCPDGYACSGGISDKIKCKDNEIPNADKTKCIFNNITQETYNTDVLDYRNIDLSNMTEKDACLYWKGEWKDNTCILPHGTMKGRFKYSWDSANKKFMCFNHYELYLAGEYDDKEYADEVKKSIDKYPNKWKLAQWDPVIEECGSAHERDCRDAGNAWDWQTAVCYDVTKNQSMCESVGAKYKINADGSRSCDCVLSDREFHWKTREQSCYYTFKSWNGNNGSTGMISGSQYSTVESCIDGLLKNNFFQNNKIEKLNCK